MTTKLGKVGMRTFAGALLAGPMIAACSSGPTYDQWAATDGAAGRINLDEVQAGFKKARSTTDFERRVNEIYEGDGMVLIRARQDTDALVLEGWEDLNKNFEIDDTTDDKLFEIVERSDKQHELRGYGGNSYYNRGFGAGDFLFTYMILSSIGPRGYGYTTSHVYARGTLTNYRNGYRGSSRYQTQVSRNSRYFSNKGGFSDSKYNASKNKLSTARTSYRSTQNTSGAFKTSSTGVRSSWGASSRGGGSRSGSRGGGFRGFGGGQVIVGPTRGS